MIILRCTRSLLRWMPPSIRPEEEPLPASPLQEWYASLVWLGGKKAVLFTSAATLYSVLAPRVTSELLKSRTALLLQSHVREALEYDQFPESSIASLSSQLAGPLVIARTRDRRVLGSINDLIHLLTAYLQDADVPPRLVLPTAQALLNTAPMSLLGYDSPRKALIKALDVC